MSVDLFTKMEGWLTVAKDGWTFPLEKSEVQAVAALRAENERLRSALRSVINAYGDRTFGTVYSMERALPAARAALAETEEDGAVIASGPPSQIEPPWERNHDR